MRSPHALVLCVALALSLLSVDAVYSQHQYDKWYFGFKQGLDFSTNPPTVLKDGETNTIEGSAVYSDPRTGALLFYTDGVIVWDRLHRQMPNGKDLIADQSSTQAALIVPDPGDSKRFYLFHCDQSGYTRPTKGMYYSVIDMRLNGGYGDIVSKNQKLLNEGSEKLTAVSLCGGEAYWVIGHELTTNNFIAWFVDINGVSPIAVRTPIGVEHGPTPVAGAGYLAASPDGMYVASVILKPLPTVEAYRFNSESGKLYDRIQLPAITQPYGVSFSPDSRKLYVCGDKHIAQYDLSVWDSTQAARSRYRMPYAGRSEGALKLGPDHKIYVQESDSLGVIISPNEPGEACAYIPAVYPLSPSGQFGLPNNIDALGGHDCRAPLARIGRHETNVCEGSNLNFKDSSRFAPTSWVWLFEGGSPSLSTERNPKNIYYQNAGTFNVTFIAYNASGSDTALSLVRIKTCAIPKVSLYDTTVCLSESVTFKDTSNNATSWQWTFESGKPETYNGRTPPPIFYYRTGKHKVTLVASNQYGFNTVTSYVTVKDCTIPIAAISNEDSACTGSTLNFFDRSQNAVTKREWMFEGGMPFVSTEKDPKNIFYQSAGVYIVRLIASNTAGADTAFSTVTITACQAPFATLNDYTLCQGECIWLEDSSTGDPTSWQWDIEGGSITGSTKRIPGKICFDNPGRYSLRLIASNSHGSDTIVKHVTVSSSAPQLSSGLVINAPLVSCVSFDTSIWIEAGCRDITLESVSSESPIAFGIKTATIAANTRLAIPLTIQEQSPRAIQTSITLRLDGIDISIPCAYTVADAPETFAVSFSEDAMIAEHCSPVTRELTIRNEACTKHGIRDIRIVSKDAQAPFYTDFASNNSILPGDMQSIVVTYYPSLPGATEAALVVTTESGEDKIFSLHGIRKALPITQVGLVQPIASAIAAGDEIEMAVRFESGVEGSIAPEEVEVTFAYNTDMLSLSHIEQCGDWTTKDVREVENGLRVRFARSRSEINANDEITKLRFKSFVAADDSTTFEILDVTCEPDDPTFSTCTLQTMIGASSSITIGAGCGIPEIRKALRNNAIASITIHPNPVTSGMRDLKMNVRSQASAIAPVMLSAEIVDLQGKSFFKLESHELRTTFEELTLEIDALPAGSYTLRTTVGGERIESHLVVIK
jgi:PKD repeat protein